MTKFFDKKSPASHQQIIDLANWLADRLKNLNIKHELFHLTTTPKDSYQSCLEGLAHNIHSLEKILVDQFNTCKKPKERLFRSHKSIESFFAEFMRHPELAESALILKTLYKQLGNEQLLFRSKDMLAPLLEHLTVKAEVRAPRP